MIFLIKTYFNGLYRVNSKNHFNVPFGKNSNPTICDEENIYNVGEALKEVAILNKNYSATLEEVDGNAFFSLNPPYKLLSQTASFNTYDLDDFNDNEQLSLMAFCDELDSKSIKWLLSNSDPKNMDPNHHFFDDLFRHYHMERVKAKRMINSVASKRR